MLLLALLLVAGGAEPERRPTRVTVDAPVDCPAGLFERELTFRTDRVALVSLTEAATASVDVKVLARGNRFEGHLKVRVGALATSKKLSGPKCESIIGAFSLAAALVLDPEGAKTGPLPAPPPEPVALPLPPEPEPVVVVVQPPQPVKPPPAAMIEAPAPEPEAALSARATVLARGLVSTGLSAAPDFGGGVTVQLALTPPRSRFSVLTHLAASGLAGRTVTATTGRVAYDAHAQVELGVGAGLEAGVLRPELGLAAQLTPVLMRGLDADDVFTSQRFLWSLGPTARLALRLGSWVVALSAAVATNLRLERYLINPNGAVLAVPAWFFQGGLEVGRSVP